MISSGFVDEATETQRTLLVGSTTFVILSSLIVLSLVLPLLLLQLLRALHSVSFFKLLSEYSLFTLLLVFAVQQSESVIHIRISGLPWKKSYDQSTQHTKKQRHYFADKGPSSQSYGFSSSYVNVRVGL